MPAINQDITHYKGDTATIKIPVLDQNGLKVDLSSSTARWWMGKSVTATGVDVYVKKATGGSGITIDLGTDVDTIVVALAAADTEVLTKTGTFYHECEVVDGSGDVTTVCVGKFTLKPTLIPNA